MKHAKVLLAVLLMCLLTVTLVACGEQGTPGKDGTSIHTGNGVPSATLGNDGDSYIDLDTFDFYVKANEKWTLSGNIKGDSNGNVSPDHNGTIGLEFYPLNDTECAVAVGTAIYLEEIVIPSTYKGLKVTTISGFTESKNYSTGFYGCENLRTITIPDSVTTIGEYAFYQCRGLTSVTFGDSVTDIGNYAFRGCSRLTSVTIGDSVTTIGSYAFEYCDSLTSVTFGENSQLTTIGYFTFAYCDSLTSVTFGENSQLTTIGDFAFAYCYSLTSIVMPDSVTTIGYSAFCDCTSLTSIVIPDSVTSIGSYAFYECYRLVEAYNKSTLNIVAGSEDNGCVGYYALNVYTEEGGSKLSTDENGFIIYTNGEEKILVGYTGDKTELVIPSDIASINRFAFYNCTSLTSVVIPDSVTTIDYMAFYNCTSLADVYYTGTKAQWNAISIGSYNSSLTNATIHYNYVVEE